MILSSKHHLIAVCIIALSASIAGAEDGAPAKIDFNLEIRPILSNKCFHCHGFDGQKRRCVRAAIPTVAAVTETKMVIRIL